MTKRLSILLVLFVMLVFFSGCGKSQPEKKHFEVKEGESFSVNVSMQDSGEIKSMALILYIDENAFEVVDGEWLNHDAAIADFNKSNKDAAIAFEEDTNYCGEIFKYNIKAKKDLTIIDDMIIVEAILKNEQENIECNGLDLAYIK